MERPQKYFCIIVKRQRKNLPSSLVVLQYLYLAAGHCGQASLKVYCLIQRGEGGGDEKDWTMTSQYTQLFFAQQVGLWPPINNGNRTGSFIIPSTL